MNDAQLTGILKNHDSQLIRINSVRNQVEHHKAEDFQAKYHRFCEKNGEARINHLLGTERSDAGLRAGFVPSL